MRRVIILGFDGLEYDLVTKFGLNSLMQKEYGKASVPLTKIRTFYSSGDVLELPSTPIVWSAFVTGRKEAYNKLLGHSFLRKFGYSLRLHKIKFFLKIFQALGFGRKFGEEQYNQKSLGTIFDFCKSLAISVPTYNEERTDVIDVYFKNVFEEKMTFEDFYDEALEVLNSKRKRFMEALEKDYELLMIHVQFADLIGHLRRGDNEVMFKTYKILSDFTDEVKDKNRKHDMLLIASDHGMKPFGTTGWYGMHSNYAFYSLNIPLNLKNPSITDFYGIIKSFLTSGMNANDKEQIMKQLKALGYF